MHAYHHPDRVRPDHRWVDWFVEFDADDSRTNGLEFVEGLWAEKLAAIAILATIAIIVVSVVWCVKGGNLQTVFTVMGFVLTGIAGEPGNPPSTRYALTSSSRNCFAGTLLPSHVAWLNARDCSIIDEGAQHKKSNIQVIIPLFILRPTLFASMCRAWASTSTYEAKVSIHLVLPGSSHNTYLGQMRSYYAN